MKLLKSRPKQRMPEIPNEARKIVHRVGLADPAQQNRCRGRGLLIALNEGCGSQSLA
jgi:hypothetical protein